jgi:hypothetical protein
MVTKHRGIMGALAVFLGLSGVALLLSYFPDFIYGPYAKANPLLNELFFPNIREAVPLIRAITDIPDTFNGSPKQGAVNAIYLITTRMFISLAGLAMALYMVFFAKISKRQRRLWGLYAFFAFAYAMLALFWEVRVITYAQLFAAIPLCALILRSLASLPLHYKGRKLFAYEILTVFMLTLLPVVILPGILQKARLMPDTIFYLGKGVESPCGNRSALISYLDDMQERGKKASIIMAPMDYTPELLFYTHQNFIAAPYHRNDRGIIDMIYFFRSKPTDHTAEEIARKLDLDYVLICKSSFFQGTLRKEQEVKKVSVSFKGNQAVYTPDAKDVAKGSLGLRLAYGKEPAWLKKRDIPMDDQFGLFEVDKKKLGPAPKSKKPR